MTAAVFVILSALSFTAAAVVIGLVIGEARVARQRVPLFVWLLTGYIALQALLAVNRVWGIAMSDEVDGGAARAIVIDSLATVILILIVLQARRIVRAAQLSLAEAQMLGREYERARRDYTQTVRHRVMNPVTVVKGAVTTLRAGAMEDPRLAAQLLDAIEESAQAIEDETLAPERRDDLERDLDALPRLHIPPAHRHPG